MDVSAIATGSAPSAPDASDHAAATGEAQSTALPEAAASASPVPEAHDHSASGLAPVVAKIFGGSHPAPLKVSYKVVEGGLGEIVTVFTDPATGKEVAQFPPSVLIGFAQFFDQESGATLDQTA